MLVWEESRAQPRPCAVVMCKDCPLCLPLVRHQDHPCGARLSPEVDAPLILVGREGLRNMEVLLDRPPVQISRKQKQQSLFLSFLIFPEKILSKKERNGSKLLDYFSWITSPKSQWHQ